MNANSMIVHILDRGLPLCRFTYALPIDWPAGHCWVGATDDGQGNSPTHVNCEACKSRLAALVYEASR